MKLLLSVLVSFCSRANRFRCFSIYLLLLCCGIYPLTTNATVEPIPVEVFGSIPDVTLLQISPDAKHLASFVRVNLDDVKGFALNVTNLENGEKSYPLFTKNDVYIPNWMVWKNEELLLVGVRFPTRIFEDFGQTPETRMFSVNIRSGEVKSVYNKRMNNNFDGANFVPLIQDDVVHFLPNDHDHILLYVAGAVHKVNLYKNSSSYEQRPEAGLQWYYSDESGRVRAGFGTKYKETEATTYYRKPGKRKWNKIHTFDYFGNEGMYPLGFDKDPNVLLYLVDHEGFLSVYKKNMATDAAGELIYSRPGRDVNGSLVHDSTTGKAVGIKESYNGAFYFWDGTFDALLAGLAKALPNTSNEIYSYSKDKNSYIVMARSSNEAGTYYLGNRKAGTLKAIAQRNAALDRFTLPRSKSVIVKAVDGFDIHGILTFPETSTKPLPTVVIPNGNMWSSHTETFNYLVQFLTNRGYAVLQIDPRGSGKGHQYSAEGTGEMTGKAQQDIVDFVNYYVKKGLVDGSKICAMGEGMNGQMAMVSLLYSSEMYKCGVAINSVLDVARRSNDYDLYWAQRVGDGYQNARKYSPLQEAKNIGAPVLVIHGKKSSTESWDVAEKFFNRVKKKNKQSRLLILDDGDNNFSRSEDRVSALRAIEEFLLLTLKPKQ